MILRLYQDCVAKSGARKRLESFERELSSEPQRVRTFYTVQAQRMEPVGLIYPWPETN